MALVLLLGLSSPWAFGQSAEDLQRGVVRITASNGSIGSGFVVELRPDAVFVVSVSHILEKGDDSPSVEFGAGPQRSYEAVIVDAQEGDEGLALLRVAPPVPDGLAVLAVEDDAPKLRDTVEVLGFPFATQNRFTVWPGTVSSRAGVNIIIAAPIDDANSGGPVLADGKVVGIVTRGGSGLGTATLALIVKTYLEGNGVDWGSSTTVRPPPLPPKPTVTLNAEPSRIERGGRAILRWSSENALTVSISPGIGNVPTSGSREVSPTRSATYKISLTGEGGTAEAEATIGVFVPTPGMTMTDPKDGLKYVWVPPGTFQMGCVSGDKDCTDDEKPQHTVTISKGFWLGQTEVTVGAYERFAKARIRRMPKAPSFNEDWGKKDHPINRVTWDEANAYCTWIGGRLPAESEWEHAARGGKDGLKYPWGNAISAQNANYGRNNSGTTPVAQYGRNEYGLYDVSGNVREWAADWYDGDYYTNSPGTDPPGPGTGGMRVLRGGAWLILPLGLRASGRSGRPPDGRSDYIGFRCAREVFP